MTKAVITEMVSDWDECDTMEYWERMFGVERLVRIMKGRDERFVGSLVSGDTPRGYVPEDASLVYQGDNGYVFSEYAEQECTVVDRY